VIRLLETLLHPGGFVSDWTSRELHTRVVARHRLAGDEYRLSQLRYDLSKLRAKGLSERIGKTRRYSLTPTGLKLGVLLSSFGCVSLAHSCRSCSAVDSGLDIVYHGSISTYGLRCICAACE
jgi:hypothetical protein